MPLSISMMRHSDPTSLAIAAGAASVLTLVFPFIISRADSDRNIVSNMRVYSDGSLTSVPQRGLCSVSGRRSLGWESERGQSMTGQSENDLIARAREVLQAECEAVRSIAGQFDETVAAVVDLMLTCQGHVLVTGTGTSSAVAQRFAHLLACCGTAALPVNAADALHGGAGAITERDVLYIISKGGQSDEVNRFAAIAKENGATIIAQTENPDSPLAKMSDVLFCVRTVGDVDPYGMIATGSSLVNSAATDAICVLVLEKRGYTQAQFARTHPGGAVGRKIAGKQEP
jgi:arabinose-5-phosphate isomerase